jgi:hypothetical protein
MAIPHGNRGHRMSRPVRRINPTSRRGHSGQCVEVADLGDSIAIRDSKNPDGPKLAFTPKEMADFAVRVKIGQFDA